MGENHSVKEFPSKGQWRWKVKGAAEETLDELTDCLVYDRRVQVQPSRGKRQTSLCEEQLGSRPDDLLASYLVGVTLKTLISSSASLLAYFHEVLRHLQNVFFLYSKGFLLHIDLMF